MNSDATRRGIDGGRIVSALGALLLIVALFLDWFGFEQGPHSGFTAWTAFELVDVLLALIAIAAIAAAFEFEARASARLPERTGAVAGIAALLLVAVSLVNAPPAAQGFDSELEIGAWLALAGAALMCAGALLSLNRVSVVITPRERPAPPPAGDPPSEAETRPL